MLRRDPKFRTLVVALFALYGVVQLRSLIAPTRNTVVRGVDFDSTPWAPVHGAPSIRTTANVGRGPSIYVPSRKAALFEFAPASGKSMGTACACAAVTGTKGEALTLTRASSGTCLKGSTTTGIANGDMVTCTNNLPRVMPGGDGSGGLGLLMEGTRTNLALRSQELDNAGVWVPSNSVAAAITITANAATAPDGTATAERFQIPAVAAGWSLVQQLALGGAGTNAASLMARGNGQSGSFVILVGSICQTCAYANGSWSVCTKTLAVAGASAFSIGQDVTDCGGGPFASQDVFLWAGQYEAGAFPTSYIATAGASVARADETASFPNPGAAVLTAGSAAATVLSPDAPTGLVCLDAAGRALYLNAANARFFDGANSLNVASGTLSATVPKRFNSDWSGTVADIRNATDSTSQAGTFTAPLTFSSFTIGNGCAVGSTFAAVLKQICVDPSPSRCR